MVVFLVDFESSENVGRFFCHLRFTIQLRDLVNPHLPMFAELLGGWNMNFMTLHILGSS